MTKASLGLALVLLSACTTKQPRATADLPDVVHEAGVTPAQTGASEHASTEDAASPDAAPAPVSAEAPAIAWTDSENVEGLAKDCAFAPAGVTRPKGTDKDFWGEGTPLSCEYGMYGQSCSADPCFDEQKSQCSPKCQKTCESCGTTCVASCKSCKTACAAGDAGCIRACATSCASCRQECVFAKDRCSTGVCGKQKAQCDKDLRVRWKTSGCAKGCAAYYECSSACPDGTSGPMGTCGKVCAKKHLGPCAGALYSVCTFNGGMHDETTE